jgi:hypothetical protein
VIIEMEVVAGSTWCGCAPWVVGVRASVRRIGSWGDRLCARSRASSSRADAVGLEETDLRDRLHDALDDAQNVLVLGRSCASWDASSSGDPDDRLI